MDTNGILWIGTEDGGLNRFDPRTKEFHFFAPSAGFTNIHGLCLVDDKLWVGTFSKGLHVVIFITGKVVENVYERQYFGSLIDNSGFSFAGRRRRKLFGNNVWTADYNPQTDALTKISNEWLFCVDVNEILTVFFGWLLMRTVRSVMISKEKWKNYL